MFGIDWPAVLQAWFKCLSQACTPVDYARRAIDVIALEELLKAN
jgi:hypothetical protein